MKSFGRLADLRDADFTVDAGKVTALIGPLTAAKAAGIVIIGIDRDLNDTSITTTNIRSDGFKGATLAGNTLTKAVHCNGAVIATDIETGSLVSKARTDGFRASIAKDKDMKFLGIQYSGNDVSKAASFKSTMATNHKDLVGVFGAETNNTAGALTGVREANKRSKVHVFGYDASVPFVASLNDGALEGTVVHSRRSLP